MRKHCKSIPLSLSSQVFHQAIDLIEDNYWKNAEFNGCEIKISSKECMKQEQPYHDYAIVHKVLTIDKNIEITNSLKWLKFFLIVISVFSKFKVSTMYSMPI